MIRVYYMKTARDGSAAARRLLGYALARDHGISDAVVAKEPTGKPYLTGHPHLCISITHTDEIVAVAIGDSPVGIDAEAVGDIRSRVAERLFTNVEREYVGDDPLRFFEIWTRKESFAKLTGDGITKGLSRVDTLTGDNTGGAVFVPLDIPGAAACVCSFEGDAAEVREVFEDEVKGVQI